MNYLTYMALMGYATAEENSTVSDSHPSKQPMRFNDPNVPCRKKGDLATRPLGFQREPL
jgi:hypothetical protein